MTELEKVCNVLDLQRQNLEQQVFKIDKEIIGIDAKIAAIESEAATMTASVLSGEVSSNIIQDTMALDAWKVKLGHNISDLEQKKQSAAEERGPIVEKLTAMIIRLDLLRKKQVLEAKARAELAEEAETEERMETWVNANRR